MDNFYFNIFKSVENAFMQWKRNPAESYPFHSKILRMS